MKFLSLHHVQIGIPAGGDARARTFYRDGVGLEEIPKPPHLAVRGGLWFRAGAQEVHLGIEPNHRPHERAHPALLVDGLDKLRRRLVEHGFEPYDDLPLDGYRRFYVKDPFGNRLEFLERIGGYTGPGPRSDEPQGGLSSPRSPPVP
ncbi:MAG: VOC family protein [Thermoplasmata archaeon]|nr:VOC family protein [Thermoplasmata archaeon]